MAHHFFNDKGYTGVSAVFLIKNDVIRWDNEDWIILKTTMLGGNNPSSVEFEGKIIENNTSHAVIYLVMLNLFDKTKIGFNILPNELLWRFDPDLKRGHIPKSEKLNKKELLTAIKEFHGETIIRENKSFYENLEI